MRRRNRRRRLFRWLAASLCFAGATAVPAWYFNWLPIEETWRKLTDSIGKLSSTETEPAASAETEGPFTDDTAVDPVVFGTQWEPPIEEFTADDIAIAEAMAEAEARNLRFERHVERDARLGPERGVHGSASTYAADERRAPAFPEQASSAESTGSAHRHVRQVANEVAAPSSRSKPVEPSLVEIDQLIESGDVLSAHRQLSQLYWNHPEQRELIEQRIEGTAETIYFSSQRHFLEPYVIQPGDQLRRIGRQYQVPWQYLSKLNRIDPRRIRPSRKLKVIKGPFSAVVDLSDYELTVHAHGYFVRRFNIGVGRDDSSPIGKFSVLEKITNPQYTDPDGRVVDSDDPSNPLGERWLGLGDGYGIHGTIAPNSIGKAESRGCIRMRNEEVEEVYDMLTVGSEIVIQP